MTDILSALAATLQFPCAVCDAQGKFLWQSWEARQVLSPAPVGTPTRDETEAGPDVLSEDRAPSPVRPGSMDREGEDSELWEQVGAWVRRHGNRLEGRTRPLRLGVAELPCLGRRADLARFEISLRRVEANSRPMILVTFVPRRGKPGEATDGMPQQGPSGAARRDVHISSSGSEGEIGGGQEASTIEDEDWEHELGGNDVDRGALCSEALERLTPRERDIALMASQGFSGPNIAARLGLAQSTVYSHLKRIHRKLGVHNRAQLAWKVLHKEQR